MSFFGQNNNQQQSSGFGGFGSSNSTTGGFGQTATSGAGFGSGNTGTTGTSGGFGGFGSGGTSGFGSSNNNTSLFGQSRPAFGSTTSSGGLFGSGTATSGTSGGGFGGFGSNNTNNTSSGGLFGSTPKPAFGNPTGGGLFGGANTGGFGSTNNQSTNAFGASTALSQNNVVCEGTGSTPFQAYTEKEGTSNMTNHFQSISFMAPYKNFSFEELRFADYNQGRRYGNGSGQAGAFGSTNFSGFGQPNNTAGGFGQPASSTVTGAFGANIATPSPFGNNQSGGFGTSNSGSTLFGPKPGGLFSAASSSGTSGSLFGTANNSSTGFGSGNTSGGFGSGSGGLFGQNTNQQQQSKPFSFGSTTSTAGGGFGSGGTGFGSTNDTTSGGGLFGSGTQANSNPFGQQSSQNTQNSNPFGGFGQQNQNQTQSNTSNPFGGFGQQNNQEQKPGGLFGNTSTSTNTGGGLFGNQNSNQSGGSLFGSNNNQSNSSSLFGQKPATGGGLFGQTNTNNTSSGGGLFGNFGNNSANQNQPQQNQGGGLFGNTNNNNQPKPGGLFGNTTSNTGGGLFGNSTNNSNQQSGGSLFNLTGSNSQQQQPAAGGSLFGNATSNSGSSLFGNSQQQQPTPQNQFQPAQNLQTSITDPNAFGSPSIFSGLPPPPQVSGPVATPISQKSKQKKNTLMPYYKINSTSPSRLQTPQKRGFGFSYSTYGSPSSASSNISTPGGLSSNLLNSNFGRSLGKSLSTSNLRGSFDNADSVLTPGAFSAGSSRYGGAGSMKKLTIDRSLRTDLFGDRGSLALSSSPEKDRQSSSLKKRVSFDASTIGGSNGQHNNIEGNNTGGDEAGTSATPNTEEQSFLRSPRSQVKSRPNGTPAHSEMEQVKGSELAVVPEDEAADATSAPPKRSSLPKSQADQKVGEYWMQPPKEHLQKMSKEQRRHVSGVTVGREGCGKVEFNEAVDLSNISLNDLLDNIIVIGLRSLTVYPDQVRKPAVGKGLNVPSTIYLENSWPRQRDKKSPLHDRGGLRFNKHVERLRRVTGTEFVAYEKDTGTWIFKVPHFTTYGFDYDDDPSEAESLHLGYSTVTEPPDTPTPKMRGLASYQNPKLSVSSLLSSDLASASKHIEPRLVQPPSLRNEKAVPGSFEEAHMSNGEEQVQEMQESFDDDPEYFLDERLAILSSDSDEDEPNDVQDANNRNDIQILTTGGEDELMDFEMAGAFPEEDDNELTMSELSKRTNGAFNLSGDWTSELQRTIQSKKQDRQALRKAQTDANDSQNSSDRLNKNSDTDGVSLGSAIRLSVYKSLYGSDEKVQTKKGRSVGRVTQATGPKSSPSASKQLAHPSSTITESDRPWDKIVSDMKNKHFARVSQTSNLIPESLLYQRAHTVFITEESTPKAISKQTPFKDVPQQTQTDSTSEKSVWILASILFDDQSCEVYGIPTSQKREYNVRIRKDRLVNFWQDVCEEEAKNAAAEAASDEERAIAHLSAHKVVEACEALIHGKNYRLATLIAQIGGEAALHEEISAQISAWRDLNVLSEMSEPIRALYSLLAGKTYVCEGKQSQHIEDRARTFPISERFSLDWKRAFGLRLYYAIKMEDPIEVAISAFAQDLEDGEPAKPENSIFWTLLRLYAASKDQLPVPSLAPMLLPSNSSPSPLTPRLSFQLYYSLIIRFPSVSDPAAADILSTLFAVQLDAAGEWPLAIFAILHVSDTTQREGTIKALLDRHANDISTDASDNEVWITLVQHFKIPEAWIWQAKALYVRAVNNDRVQECKYLIKANQWIQAHEVFRRVVGPECVIAEEWARLQDLLESFSNGREIINGWGLGGQLYADFLAVVLEDVEGKRRITVLGRLLESVPTVLHDLKAERTRAPRAGEEADEKARFREMVALREMNDVVGKQILALREQGVDAAKKLHVPRNEDAFLKETMELSSRFYGAVKGT